MYRVQTSELHDDEEQEDHDGEAGTEEVLPSRSEAHSPPGVEIRRSTYPEAAEARRRIWNKPLRACFCRLLRLMQANSSIGRAAVSKTAGWGFKSLLACQTSQLPAFSSQPS